MAASPAVVVLASESFARRAGSVAERAVMDVVEGVSAAHSTPAYPPVLVWSHQPRWCAEPARVTRGVQ